MKILVVGDGHSAIHEVAVAAAFKKLGHQVEPFFWHTYLNTSNPVLKIWYRIQNKLLIGPVINKLNSDLLNKSVHFNPDLIFIYRGTHIQPHTLIKLKKSLPICKIFGYNNDDPFSNKHPSLLWKHFLRSVPIYDLVFAYRHHNLNDLLRIGAKRVELLRSWFLPELHKIDNKNKKYKSDCIFVGHYENDNRAEYLEALILNNIKLQLFGPYKGLKKTGWDIPISHSKVLKHLLPVVYLTDQEYVKAISSAPIALCFFSKLNNDSYTRRCFEIPAIGSALFSEYSDDLASLFVDGEEAVFFKNKDELVFKVKYYLENQDKLQKIQKKGQERVVRDGHDIYSRLDYVIKLANKL